MRTMARQIAARLGVEDEARRAWQMARPAVRRDLAEREQLRRLVAWTVPHDGHCIDVGCHVGEVLRELVRAAPNGRHIAYEPLPALAADLPPTARQVLVALSRPYKHDEFATPATNQEIADELHLSVDAVKSHLRSLFGRFGIEHLPQNQKRSRLVAEALQSGVLATRDL